jgi:hypothetical protein
MTSNYTPTTIFWMTVTKEVSQDVADGYPSMCGNRLTRKTATQMAKDGMLLDGTRLRDHLGHEYVIIKKEIKDG